MKYWFLMLTGCIPGMLLSQIHGDMDSYRSIEAIYSEQRMQRDSTQLFSITFPADSDTFWVDRVRFGAFTWDTTATVFLDTQQLPVYPSGAVTDQFHLEPGWNTYNFRILGDQGQDTLTFHLFRKVYAPELPESPTAISKEGMLPSRSLILYTPQQLTVRMIGSPGGKAKFKIPHLTSGYLPMTELSPALTGGKRGVYEGTFQLRPGDRCVNQRIRFYLKGKHGRSRKQWSTSRITVVDRRQPIILRTVDEHTLVYYSPGGEILTEIQPDLRMEGLAQEGRWWRVRLSDRQDAYVSQNAVEVLPDGSALTPISAYGITSELDSNWVHLNFSFDGQPVYALKQNSNPQEITVRFYNTHFHDEWTRYPEQDSLISKLDWVQQGTDLVFTLTLNTVQQWGFKGQYVDGHFRLSIRRPPIIEKDHPFAHLIIALDAGHGGRHKGALGATGLMEKDVNLVYTKYLAAMLDSAGAQVILTRDQDTTMNLRPRAEIAREYDAHILVWLHNNSTGWTRHPDDAIGTSTYYTHLQGWPFARAIYPHLLNLGLKPEGRVHRAYFMTRQTDMVVFLVEGAFLSNPEDEQFLMKDANLKALARAVLLGMNDRLLELAN